MRHRAAAAGSTPFVKASFAVGSSELRVDLAQAVELARPLGFDGASARHFAAPAAEARPFSIGDFSGDVATGASCNCRTITLTPHCNGTHTECVAHLTVEALDAWRVVPRAPVAAIVVSVVPDRIGEDRVITRAALAAAWQCADVPPGPVVPQALILRTLPDPNDAGATAPGSMAPYVAADAASWIVGLGIAHLVLDLPSLDRTHDGGLLAAHRIFFGLPPKSRRLADAARAYATVTELAHIPDSLADGPCLLAWQVPAMAGDAVPSRPLAYRYETIHGPVT